MGRTQLSYTLYLQKSHESSKHRGLDKLLICAGEVLLVGAELAGWPVSEDPTSLSTAGHFDQLWQQMFKFKFIHL